jgi:hypothetical protein
MSKTRSVLICLGLLFAFANSQAIQCGGLFVSPSGLYFSGVVNSAASTQQSLFISNAGLSDTTFDKFAIEGPGADRFTMEGQAPTQITRGQTLEIKFSFTATNLGDTGAVLNIETAVSNASIVLKGLGFAGLGNTNEPSLQRIFDTMAFNINVGDDDASTSVIHSNTDQQKAALLGDEVAMPRFVKANEKLPVTLTVVGAFTATSQNPAAVFGWYHAGIATATEELFTLSNNPETNAQGLSNTVAGSLRFDPGATAFGFYTGFPALNNVAYTEDVLNTFAQALPHNVRVYKLSDDEYVLCVEDGFLSDFNDLVVVVRNVKAAPKMVVTNFGQRSYLSGAVEPGLFDNHLSFSRILVPGGASSFETGSLKLKNFGTTSVTVSNIEVANPELWSVTGVTFPLTLAAGQERVVTVNFIASEGARGWRKSSLTITSDEAGFETRVITLGGAYMQEQQGGHENTLEDMAYAWGYPMMWDHVTLISQIGNGWALSENPNHPIHGDEVRSQLWKKAVARRHIHLRQAAAYHPCCNDNVIIQAAGYEFRHNKLWSQTIWPLNVDEQSPAEINMYTPNPNPFPVVISGESRTDQLMGGKWIGIRTFPVRNTMGHLVKDTYLFVQDFATAGCGDQEGQANCDFNDNVYLFNNMAPADAGAWNPFVEQMALGNPALVLEFTQATVGYNDASNRATGFNDIMINSKDLTPGSNSHDASKLALDTTAGTLTVTSTATDIAGNDNVNGNNLVNGLALGFDGSSHDFSVVARIKHTTAAVKGGIFLGFDKDTFIRAAFTGGNTIEVWTEKHGNGQPTNIPINGDLLANVEWWELHLAADPVTGTVKVAYRAINTDGSTSDFNGSNDAFTFDAPFYGRIFDSYSKAGIYAVHAQGQNPSPVVYDHFSVVPGQPSQGCSGPIVTPPLGSGTPGTTTPSGGNTPSTTNPNSPSGNTPDSVQAPNVITNPNTNVPSTNNNQVSSAQSFVVSSIVTLVVALIYLGF